MAGALLALAVAIAPSAHAQGKPGGPKSGNNLPPTVIITAPGDGAIFSTTDSLTLQADASDSDGRISAVSFYRDGALIGTRKKSPYSLTMTGLATGSYSLTAVATDNGAAKTISAVVGITIEAAKVEVDSTPPSVPTGLNSPEQTSNSISLHWAASTDSGSGVAGYDLFRDGALIASPNVNSYTDSGLTVERAYLYSARARDQAGNASAQSAAIEVRTRAAKAPVDSNGKRVVGYFTQWGIYTQGYRIRELDSGGAAARLTHLNYAFGNVRDNRCEVGVLQSVNPVTGAGGDAWADYSRTFSASESVDGKADVWGQPLRGHWNQIKKLKGKYPDLKVLISLGGWTWSQGFASAARPENRQAFVASCIDAYIRGNLPVFDFAGGPGAAAGVFDGFDIDWEYPAACGLSCGSAEDSDNFTALLAEFRRQLDAIEPGLVLSAAIGAGVDKILVTRPELYQASVDYINLMTYDFHGAWESRSNFHSALFTSSNDPSTGDARFYNSHDAIQTLLDLGVSADKLNLGIATYGRGWTKVSSVNNGLYQSGTAAPGSLEAGIESYRVLKALNWPSFTDPQSLGRWIYNGSTMWSFDTPASIADKMSYVQVQGLGGAFLWDFAGDDATGSLIGAIGQGLQ